MANKKVVVAFSGGLDTSYTVMKLTQDGWDVYAACANTGGFSEEQLKKNEENAFKLGAKAYVTLDVTETCKSAVSGKCDYGFCLLHLLCQILVSTFGDTCATYLCSLGNRLKYGVDVFLVLWTCNKDFYFNFLFH